MKKENLYFTNKQGKKCFPGYIADSRVFIKKADVNQFSIKYQGWGIDKTIFDARLASLEEIRVVEDSEIFYSTPEMWLDHGIVATLNSIDRVQRFLPKKYFKLKREELHMPYVNPTRSYKSSHTLF